MPTATRTFRVFVSSTFEDLRAERDALQRDVFPRLRKLCEENGARFQAIDLRWGVRDEAALDQQTMEICLREIERCQQTGIKPNFIVLLGERYGSRPLPARIEAGEFERVCDRVVDADQRLIDDWYERDDNAVPPKFLLKPRTGEFADKDRWGEVEQMLHRILREAARDAGLAPESLIKYEASATHQEILKGLGQGDEDRKHVFAFLREPAEGVTVDAELEALKLEALKEDLRHKLPEGNVRQFQVGAIKKLCTDVEESLKKVILDETSRFTSHDALDLEIEAHDHFAAGRCRIFVGRGDALTAIADYLSGPERRPLVLHGESGSGKSAVMAVASQQYKGSGRVIRRFIGASPESASGHALLTSLCKQIAPGETPVDYYKLENAFQERLATATAEEPLVLFVDALDQLSASDPAREARWLPFELPSFVKVVVSTTDDREGLPSGMLLRLEHMTQAEGGQALDELLHEARRTLQPWQRDQVLVHFKRCGLPLYLKLAAEESRLWKSFALPDACTLGEGIPSIIDSLFDRLASNANHGPLLVERSLGYLAAARYGLTEDEMLDVLSDDEEVWQDFLFRAHHTPPERHLPVIVWSRLFLDLEPYLAESSVPGGTVTSFYHGNLRERVAEHFLRGYLAQVRHSHLAQYFGKHSYWISDPKRQPNLRTVTELIRQEIGAHLLEDIEETLTDLDYVAAKLIGDLESDLGLDYTAALTSLSSEYRGTVGFESTQIDNAIRSVRSFQDFVRHGSHLFRKAPQLVYQEALNYQLNDSLKFAAQRVLKNQGFPSISWLRLISGRGTPRMGGPVTACTLLRTSPHLIASARGETWAWNYETGQVAWRFDKPDQIRDIHHLAISPSQELVAGAFGPADPDSALRGNRHFTIGRVLSVEEEGDVVNIWDMDGHLRFSIGVGDWIYSLCWLDDTRILAAGGCPSGSSQGGQIYLLDLRDQASHPINGLSGPTPFIWVAANPLQRLTLQVSGRAVSMGGLFSDFSISLSGDAQMEKIGRPSFVNWLPFAVGESPDQCIFLCGNHVFRFAFSTSTNSNTVVDGPAVVWLPRSTGVLGALIRCLPWIHSKSQADQEMVTCLASSSDRSTIALGVKRGELQVVIPNRKKTNRLRLSRAPLSSVAVSHDGRLVAAGDAIGNVAVADAIRARIVMTTRHGDDSPIWQRKVGPQGSVAVRGSTILYECIEGNGSWSIDLGKAGLSVERLDLVESSIFALVRRAASRRGDEDERTVLLIDIRNQNVDQALSVKRMPQGSFFRVSDGGAERVLFAVSTRGLGIYNLKTSSGKDVNWQSPSDGGESKAERWATCGDISDSGHQLCVGFGARSLGDTWRAGDWGEIILADLSNPAMQERIELDRPVTAICAIPGASFLFGQDDGVVCELSWRSSEATLGSGWQFGVETKPIFRFSHRAAITGFALESKFRLVASASIDGDIRVSRVQDGSEIFSSSIDFQPRSMSFIGGTQLWVGCEGGEIIKWELMGIENIDRQASD